VVGQVNFPTLSKKGIKMKTTRKIITALMLAAGLGMSAAYADQGHQHAGPRAAGSQGNTQRGAMAETMGNAKTAEEHNTTMLAMREQHHAKGDHAHKGHGAGDGAHTARAAHHEHGGAQNTMRHAHGDRAQGR
jgi:hypothetical protein